MFYESSYLTKIYCNICNVRAICKKRVLLFASNWNATPPSKRKAWLPAGDFPPPDNIPGFRHPLCDYFLPRAICKFINTLSVAGNQRRVRRNFPLLDQKGTQQLQNSWQNTNGVSFKLQVERVRQAHGRTGKEKFNCIAVPFSYS